MKVKCKTKYRSGVLQFYVDLYVARRNTDENLNQKEKSAVKSWLNLKEEEKNLVKKKYAEHTDARAKRQAEYIKKFVPFMKKKNLSTACNNDYNVEIDHTKGIIDEPLIGFSPSNDQAIDDRINNRTFTHDNENMHCSEIPEPEPPKFKNAKEFYEMMQSANDVQEPWSQLSKLKKRRIQAAVTQLKKSYIDNYVTFLNSKPSSFLHELLKKSEDCI